MQLAAFHFCIQYAQCGGIFCCDDDSPCIAVNAVDKRWSERLLAGRIKRLLFIEITFDTGDESVYIFMLIRMAKQAHFFIEQQQVFIFIDDIEARGSAHKIISLFRLNQKFIVDIEVDRIAFLQPGCNLCPLAVYLDALFADIFVEQRLRQVWVDDVREVVLKSRYRCYPVLDENEKVVGTLSRYHLLRPRRKRVVLVDHNERAQAVPGLDQADILEIIDHHRLADIQTSQPIRVRNEPVGSTATIIAGMYQEHGVMPSANMAGLLAAAILADTVMFKSPTCTKRDIAMAERMARIGGVNIKELGRQLFSPASGKSVEELVNSDFKEFHIGEQNLGVGQVTCLDSVDMLKRKGEFLDVMRRLQEEHHYNMVILMLTDVLLEGTQLLYVGSDEAIRNAFSAEPKDNALFLPGVMSRKKQVIPMLSALWG